MQKTTFALSDFVLLLVCHMGRLVLNKNAKKPFVAICFGFREIIASLTGLYWGHWNIGLPEELLQIYFFPESIFLRGLRNEVGYYFNILDGKKTIMS